jgi:hypothetical protein
MRSRFTFLQKPLFVFFLLTLLRVASEAQVSLTATGGTTSGSYTTMTAAFSAINSGTHTGVITINITGNTTETASAALNASGSGSASYSSIRITPSGGGARIISGSIASNPLINLNGADNVMINGLNTGGNSLTFQNTNTGTSNTSTIRFIADACSNSIQNCTILGSTTSTTAGIVVFSTGTTTGNDNDTISNCTIGPSSGGSPLKAIYSSGTTTAGMENAGIVIADNNILNFFSATAASYGMHLAAGSTGWTISGNRFYQTASNTYTTAQTHMVISVLVGDGYTISGNIIGYATNTATGTYTLLGTIATRFIGINLTVGTTNTTLVQNNIISEISLSTSSGSTTLNGNLCGVSLNAGNAVITGNTLGRTSGTGSLVSMSSTALGVVVGVHTASTGTVAITNNTFGAFTSTGIATSTTIAGSVYGITVSTGSANITITGNTIGNSTANNMFAGPSATSTSATIAIGINSSAVNTVANFSKNTIQNFTSLGTGTGNARGIFTSATTNITVSYTIDSNIIHDISTNSSLTSATNGLTAAAGIQSAPGINNSISYHL